MPHDAEMPPPETPSRDNDAFDNLINSKRTDATASSMDSAMDDGFTPTLPLYRGKQFEKLKPGELKDAMSHCLYCSRKLCNPNTRYVS